MSNLGALQELLGYVFQDESLLRLALTHPSVAHEFSASTPHNERLEFLGDAVLGLVLSKELYERFPSVDEGLLSKARADLVNELGLARQAKKMNLGSYLFMSKGEDKCQGRTRNSTIADALEAIFAAVYLDGGYDCARKVILKSYGVDLMGFENIPSIPNPKGELQELLQSSSTEAPRYEMTLATGPDHDRVFECAVFHQDVELGRGSGKSKKEAESQAAFAALLKIREQPVTTEAE